MDRTRVLFSLLKTRLLECVKGGGNFVQEAYTDELVDAKGASTMRALLPGLSDPLLETALTRELTAPRAHDRSREVSVAYEAFQNLLQVD